MSGLVKGVHLHLPEAFLRDRILELLFVLDGYCGCHPVLSKLDSVATVQLVPLDALAINKRSVSTVVIGNIISVGPGFDESMISPSVIILVKRVNTSRIPSDRWVSAVSNADI